MAILGRLKKSRVDEDEDEEIDGDDEGDVNDDDEEEAGGGGLTGKLGKLRGLGKMSGAAGMLGKVMKRGSEDDDEDEDEDDDDDEDSSSVSADPAAALDLSENTGVADSAVEPGPEAGSDATPPVEAKVEGADGDAADAVPAEDENTADFLGLGDISEEEEGVDPFLRDLALSQDDTTAVQLLDELTALLNQLE